MRQIRRCECGNLAVVHDEDEPAKCDDCRDEDQREVEATRRTYDQIGATFLAARARW